MKKVKISKTDNIRSRIIHHMRYIFGHRARVGGRYSACVSDTGCKFGRCEALYYDAERGVLALYDTEREHFVLCSGDMAVFRGVLYTNSAVICLGNRREMFAYITENLQFEATLDSVLSVLKNRYHKMPPYYLKMLAGCYIAQNSSSSKI